ncbi:MAG: hypothetical protein COA97_12730 [Flavobacteriales bacterium]|nr:MAG: hypothetical protein COA97_12730 [Flavobacteriales bacterium]
MKRLNILAILIIAINFASFGQIEKIKGVRFDELTKIQFPTNEVGYIIGKGGVILKSIDSGKSWTDLTNNASDLTMMKGHNKRANLKSLYFTDANTGFIVGYKLFIKTTDGGKTWTNINDVDGEDIYFPTKTVGYVSKGLKYGESYSFKTIDGGKTWTKIPCPNHPMTAVYFIDENTGFVGNYEGQIYLTENGGENWKRIKGGGSAVKSMFFTSKTNGLILSENSRSGISSIKNGEWKEVKYVELKNENGKNKVVNKYPEKLMIKYNSMNFFDDNIGYAVGQGYTTTSSKGRNIGIIVTADGGKTWFPISNEKHERTFNSVSKNGIIVGEMGIILKIDKDFITKTYQEIQSTIKNEKAEKEKKLIESKLRSITSDIERKKSLIDRLYMNNKKSLYKSGMILYSKWNNDFNSANDINQKIEIGQKNILLLDKLKELMSSNTKDLEKKLKKETNPEVIKSSLGL